MRTILYYRRPWGGSPEPRPGLQAGSGDTACRPFFFRSAKTLLCLLLLAAVHAADPADGVREAAHGWTDAAVKQGKAALDRWLADDLTYSHSNGKVQNKAEYIAAVMSGGPHYESFGFHDIDVRVYGKTAVLTAFVDVKMVKQDSFRVRTLQVYVERNGHWQMAAHQSARLAR